MLNQPLGKPNSTHTLHTRIHHTEYNDDYRLTLAESMYHTIQQSIKRIFSMQ